MGLLGVYLIKIQPLLVTNAAQSSKDLRKIITQINYSNWLKTYVKNWEATVAGSDEMIMRRYGGLFNNIQQDLPDIQSPNSVSDICEHIFKYFQNELGRKSQLINWNQAKTDVLVALTKVGNRNNRLLTNSALVYGRLLSILRKSFKEYRIKFGTLYGELCYLLEGNEAPPYSLNQGIITHQLEQLLSVCGKLTPVST